MRFIRRGATGYYLPQRTSTKEYGYWDDFNDAGPNDGRYAWIGFESGAVPIITQSDPFGCKAVNPSVEFVSNNSTIRAAWVGDTGGSDVLFLADQYSQITYDSYSLNVLFGAGNFASIGLCVRASGGNVNPGQGYYGLVNPNSGAWQMGVFLPNGFGDLGTSGTIGGSGVSMSHGDILLLTAVGNVVTLYHNGSSVGSFTATLPHLFATGAPGIFWGGGSEGNDSACNHRTRTYGTNWLGGPYPVILAPVFNDQQGSGYWTPSV